ncbi:MAG: HAMP domain-containing histidine kinase [Alistipes sp.]|nr:HAMP domain-containing histidine kinase [Alistipes sp.]
MLNYEDFQQIKELKETNKEVYALIKKISDFCLNTLSIGFHDLKNHAAFISSYCQLAVLKNAPLTQTREFSRIETGLKDLTGLLNDISLLRYSFCDSDFIECNLSDIWTITMKYIKGNAPEEDYSIAGTEVLDNCAYRVFCNPENTAQAFYAIIINAIEACDKNTAVLSVSLTEENGMLHLSVSDNGCKFSDKMLAEGTDPFVTEKNDHTGLGLSIAATTLYMQNGSLRLSNTADGAKVTAVFPHL